MFELKVRVKSHWLLFYNGKEVRSGGKIFIRKWLKRFYPEVDYENLKVTRLPSSICNTTLTNGGWFCNLEGKRINEINTTTMSEETNTGFETFYKVSIKDIDFKKMPNDNDFYVAFDLAGNKRIHRAIHIKLHPNNFLAVLVQKDQLPDKK